jgi:ANTAR domain
VIHDATALLMDRFDLDAGQAVAQLVRVSKRQNDSIEAAARMCVDAELCGQPYPRAPEPVGDEPNHRRMVA